MNGISDYGTCFKRDMLSVHSKCNELFIIHDYLNEEIAKKVNEALIEHEDKITEFIDDMSRSSYKHLGIGSTNFSEKQHQDIAAVINENRLFPLLKDFKYWQEKFFLHQLLGNDSENKEECEKLMKDLSENLNRLEKWC